MSNSERKYTGFAAIYQLEQEKLRRDKSDAKKPSSPADSTGLIESTSPVESTGPVKSAGPIKSTSPVTSTVLALSNTGLIKSTGPVESTGLKHLSARSKSSVNMMESLPAVRGYVRLYYQIIDHLYSQLDPACQVVHLQLFRLSWGYNKPTCIIGMPKLAKRSGMGQTTAHRAVDRLEEKGLVKRLGVRFGRGVEQGIEFWVAPPPNLTENSSPVESAGPVESAAIKERSTLKENTHTKGGKVGGRSKGQDTEQKALEKKGRAARGVGVGSKFSVEECLRYAEHLQQTGQGINNPGGFATTIYRSGMADGFIEKFLHPPEQTEAADIASCPDCHGTGFYYPQGAEQGVAKCRHERLSVGAGRGESRNCRLRPEEIDEHVELIAELIVNGYTLAQAESQFGLGMQPEDWALIREAVENRGAGS